MGTETNLNHKLAEWAGICPHDKWKNDGMFAEIEDTCVKCGVAKYIIEDGGKSAYPNPEAHIPDFTQSLDACFEWLVPELDWWHIEDEVYGASACIEKDGVTYDTDGLHPTTAALALCLAIEKLIDAEKEVGM